VGSSISYLSFDVRLLGAGTVNMESKVGPEDEARVRSAADMDRGKQGIRINSNAARAKERSGGQGGLAARHDLATAHRAKISFALRDLQ
jgi:hypothetical protein